MLLTIVRTQPLLPLFSTHREELCTKKSYTRRRTTHGEEFHIEGDIYGEEYTGRTVTHEGELRVKKSYAWRVMRYTEKLRMERNSHREELQMERSYARK